MDTNENYRQFISEFATLLAHLDRCNSDVIIGGDFNIDLLKVNDKPIVSEYLDMVISHGFFPKITLPTRLSERSGTLTPSDYHFWNQNVLEGTILFFWNQYSNSP